MSLQGKSHLNLQLPSAIWCLAVRLQLYCCFTRSLSQHLFGFTIFLGSGIERWPSNGKFQLISDSCQNGGGNPEFLQWSLVPGEHSCGGSTTLYFRCCQPFRGLEQGYPVVCADWIYSYYCFVSVKMLFFLYFCTPSMNCSEAYFFTLIAQNVIFLWTVLLKTFGLTISEQNIIEVFLIST